MNKLGIFVVVMIAMVGVVSATTINFVSDSTTQYTTDFSTWNNAVPAYVYPSWPTIGDGQWIWSSYQTSADEAESGSALSFEKIVELPSCAKNIHATINMDADNWFFLSLNQDFVGQNWDWTTPQTFDLAMVPGTNTLDITVVKTPMNHGTWDTNPAGLAYSGTVTYDCDPEQVPEFGPIAGTVGLIGLVAGVVIMRRRH